MRSKSLLFDFGLGGNGAADTYQARQKRNTESGSRLRGEVEEGDGILAPRTFSALAYMRLNTNEPRILYSSSTRTIHTDSLGLGNCFPPTNFDYEKLIFCLDIIFKTGLGPLISRFD